MTPPVGDGIFPFPDPSFLFIHSVDLLSPEMTTADERGKPIVTYGITKHVHGYLTSPDPALDDSAGTERVRYGAVLLVDRCTDIVKETLVRCSDAQLPPTLAGTYKIEVVRPNISHTRCLLVRYTGAWEENTEV